jgi:hypothetical protein
VIGLEDSTMGCDRERRLVGRTTLAAVVIAVLVVAFAGISAAQTTGTTVASTTTSSTRPTTSTTRAPAPAAVDESDDDGLPWIPIAVGAAILGLAVVAMAILSARRRAAQDAVDEWRRRAADTTAEAGAMSRMLATGEPVTGEVAQALVRSLRAFDELERSAPDDSTEATARRARHALRALGRAVETDHRARRAGAPTRAEDLVQTTARETDRALRHVYRSLTRTDKGTKG